MALTNARIKAMIDAELASHTHIGYSTDGNTEYTNFTTGRTAVTTLGGWTSPAAGTDGTAYAPSNAAAGDSNTAGTISGNVTITHYATFTNGTFGSGTRLTRWIPITDPDPVLITGSKLSHAIGAIKPVSSTSSV